LNVLENEFSFGIQEIYKHLNSSMLDLIQAEQNFGNNISTHAIRYSETLMRISSDLFAQHGFVLDIKKLFIFVKRINERIKLNIARSIKHFPVQRASKFNAKLSQNFIDNVATTVITQFERMSSAVNMHLYGLECWNDYKVIYLETGLNGAGKIFLLTQREIEHLDRYVRYLQQKINSEILFTASSLLKQNSSILMKRLSVNIFVSFYLKHFFLF
jgi:hypothetical protein